MRSTEVPLPIEDLLSLARRLEAEKDYALADRLLLRALTVAPDHPDTLHLSGIVAFRLGRREEALAKIERAIERGPDIRLYQSAYALTPSAQSLVAIERICSGRATRAFQASQQASTMAV